MEEIVALCKRRGFIFPSSALYGGLQGLYDYGPLGVELKKNLKDAWWQAMVYERDDVEGLDAAILTHPDVLNQSGHQDNFQDPMIDCHQCQSRWRGDTKTPCPQCGSQNTTSPRFMDMMFRTSFGPTGEKTVILRPETAQSIFINFKHILDTTSRKLPFGIAQIGKAFRNEITVRQFIFRSREFEQMELEFFVPPGEDEAWHAYWLKERMNWWHVQGLSLDNLKVHEQTSDERAHYAKKTYDILFRFPQGFEELEGIANRADFDLGSHTQSTDQSLVTTQVKPNSLSSTSLMVKETDRSYIPFVIEPSCGLDRGVLALLTQAYHKETLDNGRERTVLKLKPHLAPCKMAVMPLARNRQDMVNMATNLTQALRKKRLGPIKMDASGNIGKAYRRHDEIGTPYCITVDHESLEENSVTLRHRDTCQQRRISIPQLIQSAPELLDDF